MNHYGARQFRIPFSQFDKKLFFTVFIIRPETTFQPNSIIYKWCHSKNESLKMWNDSDIKFYSPCVFFFLVFGLCVKVIFFMWSHFLLKSGNF